MTIIATSKLGVVISILHDIDCTCFYNVGDFHININSEKSDFSRYIHTFCSDDDLLFSCKNMLPSYY